MKLKYKLCITCAVVVLVVFLACMLFAFPFHEINNMMFALHGYDYMCEWIWIPESDTSAKDAFIGLYWSVITGFSLLIFVIVGLLSVFFYWTWRKQT